MLSAIGKTLDRLLSPRGAIAVGLALVELSVVSAYAFANVENFDRLESFPHPGQHLKVAISSSQNVVGQALANSGPNLGQI